jgi:hypothetical protein
MDVSPPNPNQTDGYLVVLKPDRAVTRWRKELEDRRDPRAVQEIAGYLGALRAALPAVEPELYRGVSRYPVDRWWEGEPTAGLRPPDETARRMIWTRYGPDPTMHWGQPPWFDPDLLGDIDLAHEVLALTDTPDDHEIVRITRGALLTSPRTLGFDIGYWGSDHFSLIADMMVFPHWHPAPREHLGALAHWAETLNGSLLFSTASRAEDYRAWYLAQPRAETEGIPGKFQVMRVEAVE